MVRLRNTVLTSILPTLISSQCTESQTSLNVDATVVQGDTTIRPFGQSGYCIYKRWLSYTTNQDLWLWPCNPDHVKYQWSYNQESGLIKSIGSEIKDTENPFCWYLEFVDHMWTQRVKIIPCDATDDRQKFDFIDGRIHLRDYPTLCIGFEPDNTGSAQSIALTAMKCYPNVWVQPVVCVDEEEVVTTEAPTTTEKITTTEEVTTSEPTTPEPTTEEPTTEEPSTEESTTAAEKTKDILFIMMDDLGYYDVSWHSDDIITPNLHNLYDQSLGTCLRA